MRRVMLFGVLAAACGGGGEKPDAGPMIDTRCGLDCAAQAKYGLIAGTCFEYSDTTTAVPTPRLAAEVKPKRELEGGIVVMDVDYTEGGQRRLQDSFTIVNGELKLVRRTFGAGGTSVSYKKTTGELEGVKWLSLTSTTGENSSTMTSADVIAPPAARVTESTTYRVALSAASSSELTVPLKTYDSGLKMLITESPTDHGSDSRRVWVPGTGFVLIATPLALVGGTSQEYRLQKIKDTADAGLCGF